MLQEITSKDNAIIKKAASLLSKKYRDEYSLFIVEGKKLIDDALNADFTMKYLFVETSKVAEYSKFIKENASIGTECFDITTSLLKKISDTVSPQGIVAVFCKKETSYDIEEKGRYIALENVSNPLNVGAIIRCVNAFNLTGIIVDDITADLFSPKVIRGSMGSVFGTKIVSIKNISDIFEMSAAKDYNIYCTAIDKEATPLSKLSFTEKDIIIIGNEGNGVSLDTIEKSDIKLYIEMQGTAQSLNASVATGIICYKAKMI
ncbi:MAG: RNA methyltransferase [Clostridia bacterium]